MQIDHVELYVPDRREAARWYAETLGLVVLPEHEPWAEDPRGPLMISTDAGKTMLALFEGRPAADREIAGFHRVAFRVGVREFHSFLERLSALGLHDDRGRSVTRASAVDHDLAWSVYFSDPWGYRLEVTTYDHAETSAALNP